MKVSRKSEGIHVQEWISRVEALYAERQTLFPVESKQLKKMFDEDYSIDEALLKDVTRGHLYAFMELHIKHELGEYRTTFRSDQDAKQFFRKFPEIRSEFTFE